MTSYTKDISLQGGRRLCAASVQDEHGGCVRKTRLSCQSGGQGGRRQLKARVQINRIILTGESPVPVIAKEPGS